MNKNFYRAPQFFQLNHIKYDFDNDADLKLENLVYLVNQLENYLFVIFPLYITFKIEKKDDWDTIQ